MEITIIFPHQLFHRHPAVKKGRRIFLVEDPLFFGADEEWPLNMHRQKLLLHQVSMQAYKTRLEKEGHDVSMVACPANGGRTEDLLEKALPKSTTSVHTADPVDDVLSGRLLQWIERRGIRCEIVETPGFLTPGFFLRESLGKGRKPLMANFYERQRVRMGILVSPKGEPTGGRWSLDAENRKRLPKEIVIPPLPYLASDERWNESAARVNREFSAARGMALPFVYPTNHEEAEKWLKDFLRWRLAGFGDYEDAISVRHRTLFHSVLTPALNIGLLTPEGVITRTLEFARDHKVPLNALEGFVRQIIGWREFIRAMYERDGRKMRTRNFWGFRRKMPAMFYDGSTGIEPVDRVIKGILATGYCHHIERLMVLGNFMLLCRIHPDEVYRWFMEMFIDSYDWVMVPNVYGMSQYADGGGFTTKPYLSGSHYILKMSDYKKGPWCEVWDALFWSFIADHEDFFIRNPRLSMMARRVKTMGADLAIHQRIAEKFFAKLG